MEDAWNGPQGTMSPINNPNPNKKFKSNSNHHHSLQESILRSNPSNSFGGGETDQQRSNQSVEDTVSLQLKNRMLASGEWLKLQKLLMQRLRGSEWEENLRCEAETRALGSDAPNLSKLINHLRPIAQNTIPTETKQEISSLIHNFINSNVVIEDQDDEGLSAES